MAEIFNRFQHNSNSTIFATPTPGSESRSNFAMGMKIPVFLTPQACKTSGQVGGKPKGLSMRSMSELNIHGGNAAPWPEKKDNFLTVKSNDAFGQPISPARQKFLQKQSLRFEQKRGILMKRKSPLKEPKRSLGESKFKSPFLKEPEAFQREPEMLAHEYDEEEDFYKNCTKNLDIEFKKLKMYMPQKDDDDEGFISDPEFLSSPKLPFHVYEDSDNEGKFSMELDLPELSDIEDF